MICPDPGCNGKHDANAVASRSDLCPAAQERYREASRRRRRENPEKEAEYSRRSLAKAKAKRHESLPKCKGCGRAIKTSNKHGYCNINPACLAVIQKIYDERKRERYHADEEYREHVKVTMNKAHRKLRLNPEYHERELEKGRRWRAANPLKVYLGNERTRARARQAKMEALINGE